MQIKVQQEIQKLRNFDYVTPSHQLSLRGPQTEHKECLSFQRDRKTEQKIEILLPTFKLLNQNICTIHRDLLGFGFHFTNIMKYARSERSTVNIMLEYNSPLLVSPLRTKIQKVYLLFVSENPGKQSLLGLGSVRTQSKSTHTTV